jgi:CPA2 family monovalent cation:H+ antiporter-2
MGLFRNRIEFASVNVLVYNKKLYLFFIPRHMQSISYLYDVIILLSAAIVIVTFFRWINLSPVLGYFVAGAAIGLHGLNVVNAGGGMEIFAEFGVVFLLFVIGTELTFERLVAMRSQVFGFGTLQLIITISIIGFACHYFFGMSAKTSAIIGGSLALSSTAIVLQVIKDTGSQSTQVGRLSLAVLLLQDFAVVPLLVLVPLLASDSDISFGMSLANAMGKAVLALLIIFILGRLFLRPLFKIISHLKSNELFVATTLLIVLGTAYVTEMLNLSMALGAFVAGLLVAETEFRQEVEQVVLPFKSLLLGLFFMTVGMSIDLSLLLDDIVIISKLAALLIGIKAAVIIIICRIFGFELTHALHAGLLLSQGSEFAFILFGLAGEQDIIDDDLAQRLRVVVTVTMALTPLLAGFGGWFARKLQGDKKLQGDSESKDVKGHVILVGFGKVGCIALKMLSIEQIDYLILDISSEVVSRARSKGFPIYRGDVNDTDALHFLGAERASAIILAFDNEITVKKAINAINQNFPNLTIIVRVKDPEQIRAYRDLSVVVPELYEIGLQLGSVTLAAAGADSSAIANLKERFRANSYALADEVVLGDQE